MEEKSENAELRKIIREDLNRDDICKELIEGMKNGMSHVIFCANHDVTEKQFLDYVNPDSENYLVNLSQSFEIGKTHIKSWLETNMRNFENIDLVHRDLLLYLSRVYLKDEANSNTVVLINDNKGLVHVGEKSVNGPSFQNNFTSAEDILIKKIDNTVISTNKDYDELKINDTNIGTADKVDLSTNVAIMKRTQYFSKRIRDFFKWKFKS